MTGGCGDAHQKWDERLTLSYLLEHLETFPGVFGGRLIFLERPS
jgi:hypothetical protein